MAGVILLPTERAGAESRPSTSCRFEPAGTGKVRAITDGRSFTLEDGREIRLAGIEVPLLPGPGDLGTGAKAGLAARAALESIIAGQNVELRQNDVADRYGRMPALVYVTQGGSLESVAHELLANRWVQFLATDAHNTTSRPPKMREAFEVVAKKYGPDYAHLLCVSNPLAAFMGKPLQPQPEPLNLYEEFKEKSWWQRVMGQ